MSLHFNLRTRNASVFDLQPSIDVNQRVEGAMKISFSVVPLFSIQPFNSNFNWFRNVFFLLILACYAGVIGHQRFFVTVVDGPHT